MAGPRSRYGAVAILLHWAIAAALILNFVIGWWMHEAIAEPATMARSTAAYQVHKSLGLTILLLALVQIGWRLHHPRPPLPEAMPKWERTAARATHLTLYGSTILVSLVGWVYVSTQWRGDAPFNVPTLWFGLFPVPHLFGLQELPSATRDALSDVSAEAHELLAWSMAALVVLHVAAALKHQLKERDGVLGHMLPWIAVPGEEPRPEGRGRRAALGAGFGLIALFIAGAAYGVLRDPQAASPSPPEPPLAAAAPAKPQAPVAPEAPPETGLVNEAAADPAAAAAKEQEESELYGWEVQPGRSEIAFAGVHAGIPFRGRFARWSADIRFAPERLEDSSAVVRVETASASDGFPLHDESMPGKEWFDVENHPTATFRTSRIIHSGGSRYRAAGTLTLKRRSLPVDLPFTLTIRGDRATMEGRVRIDRAAADLGMESDPGADYVSRIIDVEVKVEALRR